MTWLRPRVRFGLLALVGAAGAAVLSTASADTQVASAGRLRSEKTVRARIAETEVRLLDLCTKASQDNRITKIERYLSWTEPDQFVSPKKDVTARQLVEYMADEKAPTAVREKARDALLNSTARSLNPDLASGQKGSKRAAFSKAYLVPLLKDKDAATCRYADKVLNDFWYPSDKDIARYNPEDQTTWAPAIAAWLKILASK